MIKPIWALAAISLIGTAAFVAVVAFASGGDDQAVLQVETAATAAGSAKDARNVPTCDPRATPPPGKQLWRWMDSQYSSRKKVSGRTRRKFSRNLGDPMVAQDSTPMRLTLQTLQIRRSRRPCSSTQKPGLWCIGPVLPSTARRKAISRCAHSTHPQHRGRTTATRLPHLPPYGHRSGPIPGQECTSIIASAASGTTAHLLPGLSVNSWPRELVCAMVGRMRLWGWTPYQARYARSFRMSSPRIWQRLSASWTARRCVTFRTQNAERKV